MTLKLNLAKKNERIMRKTNRKADFNKFIASGYTDLDMFKRVCKNDEDLMIYCCLKDEEIKDTIEKIKDIPNQEDQMVYLKRHQPYMNENLERYERCCEFLASHLKGFIEYSAFRSANANGSYEDFTSEFWLKYVKVCDFYKERWFHQERLGKKTKVKYKKLLYKEFLYVLRSSIASERKHLAFKATQDMNASVFKASLDTKFEQQKSGNKSNEKTLGDVLPDQQVNEETLLENAHSMSLIDKALSIAKTYPDGKALYNEIADFYEKQDTVGVDKKVIVLAKIFLYRAGLVSPKVLTFIKGLSPTYKQTYGISNMRLLRLLSENKPKKQHRIKTSKERSKEGNLGWKELIIMRRGEL